MPAETDHYLGGTKHFECRVKGHPRPNIRWFKDSVEITSNPRYKFDHSHEGIISMVIENITHDDEGHYRCRAENSEGIASTSAYLIVRAHKEHPEEAETSIHSMEIEEAIVFNKKTSNKQHQKNKSAEPHFETPIEDIDEPNHPKERRLSQEEEELVKKTFESFIENATSVRAISPLSPEDCAAQCEGGGGDMTEQDSAKIKEDTSEKLYQSSDESTNESSSKVVRTISENSVLSRQESSEVDGQESEKSLLMQQTERIIAQALGSDSDSFSSDSVSASATSKKESTMMKVESTSSKCSESFVRVEGISETRIFASAKETSVEKKTVVSRNVEKCSAKASNSCEMKESVLNRKEHAKEEGGSGIESSVNAITSTDVATEKAGSEEDRKAPFAEEEPEDRTNVEQIKTSWVDQVSAESDAGRTLEATSEDTNLLKKNGKEVKDEEEKEEAKAATPKLVQKTKDTNIEQGNVLKLRTTVQGTPRPEVTWSKAGEIIEEGERITIVTDNDVFSLEISDVTLADSGTYRMTASNSGGQIFSDIVVTVVSAEVTSACQEQLSMTANVNTLQFAARPQSVEVAELEPIKLSCSFHGASTSNPKVTWEKDGVPLRSNRRIRLYEARGTHCLEIRESDIDDQGEYTCCATNSHGTVSATVSVTIEGASSNLTDSSKAENQGATSAPSTATSSTTLTEGAKDVVATASKSTTDVGIVVDTRAVRYLKLFGAAAAFSLAAYGVKKIMDNFPK